MSLSKKLAFKGTLRQVFYVSEAPPLLWPPTAPPYTYVYAVYLFTQRRGGGEPTKEKVRGAIVHKAGQKYKHDWQYLQSINSIKHQ